MDSSGVFASRKMFRNTSKNTLVHNRIIRPTNWWIDGLVSWRTAVQTDHKWFGKKGGEHGQCSWIQSQWTNVHLYQGWSNVGPWCCMSNATENNRTDYTWMVTIMTIVRWVEKTNYSWYTSSNSTVCYETWPCFLVSNFKWRRLSF